MDSPFDSEALETTRELLLGSERCARVDAILVDAEDVVLSGPEAEGLLVESARRTNERVNRLKQAYVAKGVDAQLVETAEAEVAEIISGMSQNPRALKELIGNPKGFPGFLAKEGAQARSRLDESVRELFDELLTQSAEDMAIMTPWSSEFNVTALRELLDDQVRTALETNHFLDVLTERIKDKGPSAKQTMGAWPQVSTTFIERPEFGDLADLVLNSSSKRTVLVGMCGAGKTQIAAKLVKQCYWNDWPFVVWIDARDRENIVSEMANLGMYMGAAGAWKMTPERRVEGCLNALALTSPRDRLFVFDGVDRVEDLEGLVPEGLGLRVIATSRRQSGWAENGWHVIPVGAFTREQSVDYLLAYTEQQDRENANRLAEELGDLPAVLSQAAADIWEVDSAIGRSIGEYCDLLRQEPFSRISRKRPGLEYPVDIVDALHEAVARALEDMDSPEAEAASEQLRNLAAPHVSGLSKSQLLTCGRDRAVSERGLDGLLDYSVCQQDPDGLLKLNRFLVRILRERSVV